VGVPYSSNLSTTGGLPPYSFSVAGSLPSGLTLNPSTGEIAGTPNTPGTFSFTPQVMDASGNQDRNTVQSQCDIAVTTPPTPLALACPTPNDEEGVRYSSSLVATGGAPPYVFSITSGSLPPGLSLNPASGAIRGIDTTALGSFPFTARVVGSGNGAANMAMINCLVMAAAQKLKMVAATATTPQTVVVGTALGMPLAVIVTDADTGKPVAGVTVTFSVTIKPQNIPSGIFTGGVNNELNTMNSVDVNTDKNGLATAPTFTANGVLGNYAVIARLAGVPSVSFKLTNLVGPPFNIKATPVERQTTVVGALFKTPLAVNVTDRFGNPVPNWPVIFAAPVETGPLPPPPSPSATLGNSPTFTNKTDSKGNVSSPRPTANTFPGSYFIVATVAQLLPTQNLPVPALFPMTNLVGPPAKIIPILPANDATIIPGTPPKPPTFFATINKKFTPLVVRVTDKYDNPLKGWQVRFAVTKGAGGAAGTFPGSPDIFSQATTGDDGQARAGALTANNKIGGFTVEATVLGTNGKAPATTFDLFNKGQVAVPNVMKLNQTLAEAAINKALLNIGTVTRQASQTFAADVVISQFPIPTANVDVGSKVDLTVSSGPPKP
jgi:hypothetical protein